MLWGLSYLTANCFKWLRHGQELSFAAPIQVGEDAWGRKGREMMFLMVGRR